MRGEGDGVGTIISLVLRQLLHHVTCMGLSSAFSCRPPYGYISPSEILVSTFILYPMSFLAEDHVLVMEMEVRPLNDQIYDEFFKSVNQFVHVCY